MSSMGLIYVTGYGTDGKGKSPALLNMNNENVPITKICAGYDHHLFIDKHQRLITWGENDCGQSSPDSSVDTVDEPALHPYFSNKIKDIKIQDICAGVNFSLCVDIDGMCYLFSEEGSGKLGNGKESGQQYVPFTVNGRIDDKLIVDAALGEEHTISLTNDNNVITFGYNYSHQCSSMEWRKFWNRMLYLKQKK